MNNSDAIQAFGWQIQNLINGKDLTRAESYAMFRQILGDAQPDLQQGAFLAALAAKGETPEEIAGAWQAIFELDTNKAEDDLGAPLVENSGTGMDALKTFNVSSAAAVVAAAGGVRMARHGARALTSTCGTVDLLEALGIDVECGVPTVAQSIRQAGIGLFNGMSPKVHPRALARILAQIRFGSTLNIAASLASPCRPTHGLRGVYAETLISPAATVMKAIGYQRALVVHGFDGDGRRGMDELSTLGESRVRELAADGSETTFTLTPEDVGLPRRQYAEIAATGDKQAEAVRFLQTVAGHEKGSCEEITSLNAGAIFYLVDKTRTLSDGVYMARELIREGRALRKLAEWATVQADPGGRGLRRLEGVADRAGLGPAVAASLECG
jgi:anthranilate phosphoribosyltransferase